VVSDPVWRARRADGMSVVALAALPISSADIGFGQGRKISFDATPGGLTALSTSRVLTASLHAGIRTARRLRQN